MKNAEKYTRNYFMPPENCLEWAKKEYITKPPMWCSVDLRDGNQSLIVPMSLEEKIEFWNYLVKVGFKEIEIGFPAASDTEYEFCRALIEQELIPEDVTIQVLTQARPHIIEKTFQALDGAKNAVVHLYNSTSVAQREQVFQKSKQEIIEIAVSGAKLFMDYIKDMPEGFRFEYSPESFTGTEMEFALDICNAVLEVWKPTPQKKVIINLPVTVSHSMPHVYASQVEYMCKHMKYRESVIVSLHPHNDRGCAVADSELGLLAGADRIEGTLFGNGERTGNVDIVTLALNMYSHGVEPGLDFTNLPELVTIYERITRMEVYDRQPYSGSLVFAAFSGSHQDAIAKGMSWRDTHNCNHWTVPYLAIDPKDLGREYEADVIRINSQSGKGGIGYVLEQNYGYKLPAKMREDLGYTVKGVSDREHRELSRSEVHRIFKEEYVNFFTPIDVTAVEFTKKPEGLSVLANVTVDGKEQVFTGTGNGRLDAVANALMVALGIQFSLVTYEEHALERGTNSRAVAYVGIAYGENKTCWGAGTHDDIMSASVNALVSAINRAGCSALAK